MFKKLTSKGFENVRIGLFIVPLVVFGVVAICVSSKQAESHQAQENVALQQEQEMIGYFQKD